MIVVPSRGPADWRSLLADPAKHWRDGYSAKSAALSWEAAQATPSRLPPEVASLLPAGARLLLAIPEHKVALPGGGAASQCDVFALVHLPDGLCALAVEAKVEEPFDLAVGEWLARARDDGANRRARLRDLAALLGLPDVPAGIRYQLVHRTAAAVIEARRFHAATAAMIVQSFSPARRWFDDFAAFAALLGARAEPDRPASLALPDGRPLLLGWATGALAEGASAAIIGP